MRILMVTGNGRLLDGINRHVLMEVRLATRQNDDRPPPINPQGTPMPLDTIAFQRGCRYPEVRQRQMENPLCL